ncbi:MAG: single-stranded DNA-binding protein [Candidatus Komeilibacteria bacterium]|nr:single-stranded DNA-binding protein [Candidatus Komeilibacteria bacterium]
MDLNKAMLIGRLTQDPESRSTPGGENVASFSVATNFRWTDRNGQRQEKSEFHNIVAWRKLAEICSQYLKKGSRVYIEGRLQTRSWEDQNGVKKYRTEIIADNMIMLDSRGEASGASNRSNQEPASYEAPANEAEQEINVEDIPF